MTSIQNIVHQSLISIEPDSIPSKVTLAIPVIGTIYYHAIRHALIQEFQEIGREPEEGMPIRNKIIALSDTSKTYTRFHLIIGTVLLGTGVLSPLGTLGVIGVTATLLTSFGLVLVFPLPVNEVYEARLAHV